VYNTTVGALMRSLPPEDIPLAVTADGWTTSSNVDIHWCSFTVHWIREGRLNALLLDLVQIEESATAEHLQELWTSCLDRWDLTNHRVECIVTDGAANYQLSWSAIHK